MRKRNWFRSDFVQEVVVRVEAAASCALAILFLLLLGVIGYFMGPWPSLALAVAIDIWDFARLASALRTGTHDSGVGPLMSAPFYLAATVRMPVGWPFKLVIGAVLAAFTWLWQTRFYRWRADRLRRRMHVSGHDAAPPGE